MLPGDAGKNGTWNKARDEPLAEDPSLKEPYDDRPHGQVEKSFPDR